jgi:hypothetical protein
LGGGLSPLALAATPLRLFWHSEEGWLLGLDKQLSEELEEAHI